MGLNGNTRRTSSIPHPITVNELHGPNSASNGTASASNNVVANSTHPDSIVVNNDAVN